MGVLAEKFKSDFHLVPTGQKGWYISRIKDAGLSCPCCHSENSQKLAFIFSDGICSFRCVKCGESMRLEKYLWKIRKQQYITNQRQIQSQDILKKKILTKQYEKEEIKELEEVSLPILLKKIKYHPYLQKRGASLELYKHWIIGQTKFEDKLKDYIIFVIPENHINVGWVARSTKSKKEIDEINKKSKYKILRWRNSKSDFGKIVFGLDEITDKTKKLIIVEGITSKLRIDCELKLFNNDEIKCCCTFGKKMTEIQLFKIKNKGINVETIILFYDSDAIKESKNTSYKLKECFKKVLIAFCDYKNEDGEYKDAGDLNKKELELVFSNLKTPFEFFESKMNKKKLI